jgi:hypothetical protein
MRRLTTYHLRAERGMVKHRQPMISREYGGAKRTIGSAIMTSALLTGIDAPVEQVMYLDRVITARTQRTGALFLT